MLCREMITAYSKNNMKLTDGVTYNIHFKGLCFPSLKHYTTLNITG
jgi:hypothetical protein